VVVYILVKTSSYLETRARISEARDREIETLRVQLKRAITLVEILQHERDQTRIAPGERLSLMQRLEADGWPSDASIPFTSDKEPSRRDVSQKEFNDRICELGFQDLREYLASELWQSAKRAYRRSDYPQRCLVCGALNFELHHRTYAHLGAEELFDLVPLCPTHHQQLHEILDNDPSLCVKDTHDYLIKLYDRNAGVKSEDLPERPNDLTIPF
jgi:hypothetical protein